MKQTRYYKIAGHTIGVTADEVSFGLMTNYEPFAVDSRVENAVLMLTVEHGDAIGYTEELRQEDEGQYIICGHTADSLPVFEFVWNQETAGWLVCKDSYRQGHLIITGRYEKLAIDNALMVLYALATADKDTVLFHAAVVSYRGKGYMFLGKSGTGKSTHARLWLAHVEGSELVNDDNPVVREGIVYGSPWSGKTPCYRNVSCPLGGIVLLSQAPHNRIRRLRGIEAYAALVPSISGKRWDRYIADGLHQTENALAMKTAVWHLECLPDEAAARLCNETITRNE